MPFFFPSALLTNFTKSSPRGTISSALRYQMLQNCKISAGSMTSRILIVTPAILRQFTDANSFALPFLSIFQGITSQLALLTSRPHVTVCSLPVVPVTPTSLSDIKCCVFCMFINKHLARRHIISHQKFRDIGRHTSIFDLDAF